MNIKEYGFFRAGVAVPTLKIGNPMNNIIEIKKLVKEAELNAVDLVVFPELCITGYTCADLFNQTILLDKAYQALYQLICDFKESNTQPIVIVGMPIRADNQLFNCGVIISRGRILGIVPKTYIPNYSEFYEKRWFSASNSRLSDSIEIFGETVPFSPNILFKLKDTDVCIGMEICEDLWTPIPPSSRHSIYGANIIANLSASNELIGKSEYRNQLISQQSARCYTAYLYASAGQTESTTDLVFGGHSIIAESGTILKQIEFEKESTIIYSDIDIEKLMNERRKSTSFMNDDKGADYKTVSFDIDKKLHAAKSLEREINAYPFVPFDLTERAKRCEKIIKLQATGLAQRMSKAKIDKAVIGISGGLDSTLALLVAVEATKILSLPISNVIGITMPGFGTTNRTYQNALKLMQELGVTSKEISIVAACLQHFKDIGHDATVYDVTYENVQARERTQILMDIANKENGLVVGTGDLSELALGWCTYNADQMSMYSVNSSVPKTLVRYLVEWYSYSIDNKKAAEALKDILDTPISPELLPPDINGDIEQKTEDIVGNYILHDFFLYHMIRNGYSPSKIYFLATIAMKDMFDNKEINKWLKVFYKRFFTQQFKRSCMPDGVKVGSICLSPRGDWRMPSDADFEIWLDDLKDIF